jgi:tetratricopeptide (TPR) repeat protein
LENVGLAVEGLGFKAEHGRRYQKAVASSIHHERRGDKFQKDRNHGKAINEYRQAIALEEEILGKLHPVTTKLLQKIASICKDQEDYDSALLVYSKVLAINEAAFGKDNAETIKSFNDVSTAAQKQAAASGSTPEGWTTLNYILLGLIGLLILILNAAKALSKKDRPLRNMKMPLYEAEIEDSSEIGEKDPLSADKMSNDPEEENNTGIFSRDPEEIKKPSQAPQDRSAFFSERRRSLDPPSEKLSEGGVGIQASLLSENASDLEAESAENGEDLLSVSVVNETMDFELQDVEEQERNENSVIRDYQVDEDASMDGSATLETFPSKESLLAQASAPPPLPSTQSNAPEDSRDTAENNGDAVPAAAAPPNPETTQSPEDEIAKVEGYVDGTAANQLVENKAPEFIPKDNPGETDDGDDKPDAGANPSGEQAIEVSPVEGEAAPADDPNLTKESDPTDQADGKERLEAATKEGATASGVQADDSVQSVVTAEQDATHTPPRKSWAPTPSAKAPEESPSAQTAKTEQDPVVSVADRLKALQNDEEPVISVADRLKALNNRLKPVENKPADGKAAVPPALRVKNQGHEASSKK